MVTGREVVTGTRYQVPPSSGQEKKSFFLDCEFLGGSGEGYEPTHHPFTCYPPPPSLQLRNSLNPPIFGHHFFGQVSSPPDSSPDSSGSPCFPSLISRRAFTAWHHTHNAFRGSSLSERSSVCCSRCVMFCSELRRPRECVRVSLCTISH